MMCEIGIILLTDLLCIITSYCVSIDLRFVCIFNVICNDISAIYVTAHTCAGELKKKLDLMSGSNAIDISMVL